MDLTKHLIDYQGRPYLPVVWRVVAFREKYPNYGISTSVTINQNSILASAEISDDKGRLLSRAHKSKPLADKDAIAKAETGAVGRALSFFGIGTELAVQDLEEGDEIVDKAVQGKTVQKTPPPPTTSKPIPNAADNLKKGALSEKQIGRLWAIAKSKNISNNEAANIMMAKYGTSNPSTFTKAQYDDICSIFENIEKHSEAVNSQEIPF